VKAALAGLAGVTSVEHEVGTDVFVVRHDGELDDAAKAVDRVVILKWARRGLEYLKQNRAQRQY
jgi:hypothetical protein